jgi:hypothetical protein
MRFLLKRDQMKALLLRITIALVTFSIGIIGAARWRTSSPIENYRAPGHEADWLNPYLDIDADDVALRAEAASTHRSLSPDEVLGVIKSLPESAWPYGKVVLIRREGLFSGGILEEQRREQTRMKIEHELSSEGIVIK